MNSKSHQQGAIFRSLVESAPVPIFSVDRNYRYSGFNQAHATGMRTLYGAEIELGQCMLDYLTVEEDRRQFLQNLNRAMNGETLTVEAYAGDNSRSRRYLQLNYNPFVNGELNPGVAVFVTDLTAHKNNEPSPDVLGKLSGSIGHELRNPLGVISNAVYYLHLIQPNASEKVIEYLDIIQSETHRAAKIINDLLDYARVKSVDREPVVVADLIEQMLQSYPAENNVIVHVRREAGLPRIFVDPHQLIQVLGNLTLNAYQAMPGGGELLIESRHQSDGHVNRVAISLQDTGIGIPPENMARLFEPSFTTKTKGIGLGLPICQKMLAANDGSIEVMSEPGNGSRFTIYLPVFKDQG